MHRPDRRVGGLRTPAARPKGPAGGRLRNAVQLRASAERIGQVGKELPAGGVAAGVGHRRVAARDRRRRGGRRRARPCRAAAAAQRDRPARCAVDAGHRRGGFRDRAPAAVRADARPRTLQAARRGGARLPRAVPVAARGVPGRMLRIGLREAAARRVLRLMAAVIHCLWERGDRNPMIMPATLPIDDPRVRDELTRYLPDSWKPIIESDIDGANSLPLRIDAEAPNLGKLSATRRVARTIYLGSAPLSAAATMGL